MSWNEKDKAATATATSYRRISTVINSFSTYLTDYHSPDMPSLKIKPSEKRIKGIRQVAQYYVANTDNPRVTIKDRLRFLEQCYELGWLGVDALVECSRLYLGSRCVKPPNYDDPIARRYYQHIAVCCLMYVLRETKNCDYKIQIDFTLLYGLLTAKNPDPDFIIRCCEELANGFESEAAYFFYGMMLTGCIPKSYGVTVPLKTFDYEKGLKCLDAAFEAYRPKDSEEEDPKYEIRSIIFEAIWDALEMAYTKGIMKVMPEYQNKYQKIFKGHEYVVNMINRKFPGKSLDEVPEEVVEHYKKEFYDRYSFLISRK